MEGAMLKDLPMTLHCPAASPASDKLVNAKEFRQLLVSHRRLIRADRRSERLKGLQDLDTGEVFLTDERRLLEAGR